MKTKMTFRHKFAYSFFNFSAYKEFLIQGFGKALLYLFLVTLILSTVTNINKINILNSEISNVQDKLVHNAPIFELKNGLLSVDSTEPIYYKHSGEFLSNIVPSTLAAINIIHTSNSEVSDVQNKTAINTSDSELESSLLSVDSNEPSYYIFIVDTNNKTNSSILNSYSDGMYINSNGLVIKENYRTIQTIKFADYPKLIITNTNVQAALVIWKFIFPIFLLIINPILSFLTNLASIFLILGPLCLFISSFMRVKLNYSKACILSFYAITLPLLLEALLEVAGILSTEFSVIFYTVALIYCGLAIKEIKNIDKSNLNYMK